MLPPQLSPRPKHQKPNDVGSRAFRVLGVAGFRLQVLRRTINKPSLPAGIFIAWRFDRRLLAAFGNQQHEEKQKESDYGKHEPAGYRFLFPRIQVR